jgi:penicillin amidase
MAGVALVKASDLSDAAKEVLALLQSWDRVMSVGSTVPVIFAYLVSELTVLGTAETGGQHWVQFGFLYNALHPKGNTTDPACTMLGFETCTAFLGACLENTAEFRAQLTEKAHLQQQRRLPNERGRWSEESLTQWGKTLHPALFEHAILGKTPLACLANRYADHGGDWSTVNVGSFTLPSQRYMAQLRAGGKYDNGKANKAAFEGSLKSMWEAEAKAPLFEQTAGPSYRGVYDLETVGKHGVTEQSVFLNPLGQSGNILSKNYDNLLQDWATTQYLPMKTQGYKEDFTQKLKAK